MGCRYWEDWPRSTRAASCRREAGARDTSVRGEEVCLMSLLMLAVVALFPVSLLAILLVTSGLEGRFVSSKGARRARHD
jgi:hypothetical protein